VEIYDVGWSVVVSDDVASDDAGGDDGGVAAEVPSTISAVANLFPTCTTRIFAF
jgi:hypothetical protein